MCASHHITEILNWVQIKQPFYCCCGPLYHLAGLVHYLFLAQSTAFQRWTERCSVRSWQINSSLVVGKWKFIKQVRVGSWTAKPSFNEMKETVLKSAEAPVSEILNLYRIRAKNQRHDQINYFRQSLGPCCPYLASVITQYCLGYTKKTSVFYCIL